MARQAGRHQEGDGQSYQGEGQGGQGAAESRGTVMRAAQGEVVTQLSVECYTQPVYKSLVWRQQSNWH